MPILDGRRPSGLAYGSHDHDLSGHGPVRGPMPSVAERPWWLPTATKLPLPPAGAGLFDSAHNIETSGNAFLTQDNATIL